jgi:hypothetical protein
VRPTLNFEGLSEMPNLVPLIGRLRAFEAGRAVPTASHLQIAIQPHALIICCLAMAGEDTTVHAVAVGHAGQAPQCRVVADPRVRDDHFALFAWLLGIVEPYFTRCRADGDFPQIWVSSGAGAGHLDTLADRLRYTRDNPSARRLGELFSYATERYPVSGQQALVTATGALRLHFATGQQEGEDEHLGTFVTWIDPPANIDVFTAVALAEQQPMGVKTDPVFAVRAMSSALLADRVSLMTGFLYRLLDRDRLAPLLAGYNEAKRRNATPREISQRAQLIEQELIPIVDPIYRTVQHAYSILNCFGAPSGLLAPLHALETYEFESFMQSRDAGHFLPYRDGPKSAAFKLAAREDAITNIETGAVHGDIVARTKAYLGGTVLRAQSRTCRQLEYRGEQCIISTSKQGSARCACASEMNLPISPTRDCDVRSEAFGARVR